MSEKKSILVIDDDKNICDSINDILTEEGYEVVIALDGQKGLEEFKVHSFDLVIFDINMPVLGGIEFFNELLKKSSYDLVCPMIVLTVREDLEQAFRGFSQNIKDYISKPFDPVDLLKKVEDILA